MESAEGERADLLDAYAFQRGFLLGTVDGLVDDQARQRTTVSELSLGGLFKHLAETESGWMDFVEGRTAAVSGGKPFEEWGPEDWQRRADSFRLLEHETLAEVVEAYQRVTHRTDELMRTVDLEESHELPPAPWFAPGARRSNRRVFLHMLSELAQHCGHADIIREALDGRKSMG